MTSATVTSKGQLTIPKAVREALGLSPGDRVVFLIEDEKAWLQPVRARGLLSLQGIFAGREPFKGREAERAAARAAVVEKVLPPGGW